LSKGDLYSARLRLYPVALADIDAIAELNADAEVMRYITGRAATHAESAGWVERHIGVWAATGGLGAWAIREAATGDFLGRAVLRPFGDDIELGYALRRRSWGLGYATETGGALLEYGFEALGLERVIAFISRGNDASEHVLLKLGFEGTGDLMFHGESCPSFALNRAGWMASAGQQRVEEGTVGSHELFGEVGEADQSQLMVGGLGEAGDTDAAQVEHPPIHLMEPEVGLLQDLD
jgi:RimJ/RimL family protein N-acetyltransferase